MKDHQPLKRRLGNQAPFAYFGADWSPLSRWLVRWAVRAFVGALTLFVLKYGWDYSIAEYFSLPPLSWSQAVAMYFLSRALTGFPEFARTMHRLSLRDLHRENQAFMRQQLIHYFGPNGSFRSSSNAEDEPPATTIPRSKPRAGGDSPPGSDD